MLVLLVGISATVIFHSCSTESSVPRKIRGHTLTFGGIAHGSGASRAERYCTQCHGENLTGGSGTEPACLTCHGKNWLDSDPTISAAPGDHTVINGGFRHHPELQAPAGTCISCHGVNLEGDATSGQSRPSCFLCHDQKWQ